MYTYIQYLRDNSSKQVFNLNIKCRNYKFLLNAGKSICMYVCMHVRSDKKQLLIVAEKRFRIKLKKNSLKILYYKSKYILHTQTHRCTRQIVKILEPHKVAKQLSNLLLRRAPTFCWIHTALPICSYSRQSKKSLGHKQTALPANCKRLVYAYKYIGICTSTYMYIGESKQRLCLAIKCSLAK